MNYYKARQQEKTKLWHFTCMNDGQIWPVGACSTHDGHNTSEEAERCFYDHCVSELIENKTEDVQVKCAVPGCGEWTQLILENKYVGGACLCQKHFNAEGFKEAFPFRPGISITASW